MKRLIILAGIMIIFFNLAAFDFVHYDYESGILQSDVVYDVFLYDTSNDNIADDWRTDSTKSWFMETSNPSDDFTGTELDENRWQEMPGEGSPTYDDWVDLSGTIDSGSHQGKGIYSADKWRISGDFDIQISFKDFSCDDNGEFRFAVFNMDDYDQEFSVARRKTSDGLDVYINNGTNETVSTEDENGRLRIARNGSDCSAFYGVWDSESGWSWSQIGEDFEFGTFDVYVAFYHFGEPDNSIEVKADDFILDSGTTTFINYGSVTRSTVSEFPAQVFLVATDKGLDIIDAAHNELWMRFKSYDHEPDLVRNQNIVADMIHTVFALDGKIYCGAYDGYMSGLCVIDFTQDKAWFYDPHEGISPHGTGWDSFADISQRNKHRGWTDVNAEYVPILGYSVYDIKAKVIDNGREEKTYVALANGLDLENSMGTVTVINLEDNTVSYDKTNELKQITNIDISPENHLYYLYDGRIFLSMSDYLTTDGIFDCDASAAISTTGNSFPSDLLVTNNFVYISDKSADPEESSWGSTYKKLLDLSSPSSQLNFEMWGTSSCSALATDNNAIWIATNHSEQGRVYIAGAENPLQDELRGDFNLPSPLSSGCISCLSFGATTEFAENLLVGYEDGGVTRIFGRENTISLNNLEEGSIQHNFSSLSCEQFTYHFLNTDITVNPNDLGPDYGNTEVTVHLQDPVFPAPVFPHPEFTLDFWYQIKTEESFTAFPCEVRVEFSSPTPNGDENLQLWNYSESENEWIPDSADEEVTVTNWNFTSSPYFVDYTTEHFSSWAMNDGSGGALAFPPQSPDNIRIVRNESTVTITWDEVTEDTWGNSIENVSYDIYSSENPYSDWELEISGLTETSWNYQHASESKKFFRIVAVYVP